MSNPWGIKLKKTGLTEQRLTSEQKDAATLEQRQAEMARNLEADKEKYEVYSDRQASLAADATYGQQERFKTGGRRIGTSRKRRTRKTRRVKNYRRTRKSTRHHRNRR